MIDVHQVGDQLLLAASWLKEMDTAYGLPHHINGAELAKPI